MITEHAQEMQTHTDELIVLAETIADIKTRFERVESDFVTQAKPLEAAATALEAAIAGIKGLQYHVLDNNLGALSDRVEKQRTAIDEQIGIIATELKRADSDAANSTKATAEAVRGEIAELGKQLGSLTTQFGAELKRVELDVSERAQKFATLQPTPGRDGISLNPTGSYAADRAYARNDIVAFLGGSFISMADGNRERPTSKAKNWMQLASRGGPGGGSGDITGLTGVAMPSQICSGSTVFTVGDVLYANTTGTLTPLVAGTSGQFLQTQGASAAPIWAAQSGTGAGDVASENVGTTVDNTIARWHGTGGQNIQASVVTIADTSGDMAIPTATAKITLGAATETVVLAVTALGAATILPKTGVLTIPHATGTLKLGISTEVGTLAVNGFGVLTLASKTGETTILSGNVTIGNDLHTTGNLVSDSATGSLTLGTATEIGTLAVDANGALTLTTKSGQDLTITTAGAKGVKATGTGSHVFGTTNTVTLAAGAVTATAVGAHTFGTTNTVVMTAGAVTANAIGAHTFGTTNVVTMTAGALSATASLACTAATAALTLGTATETLAVAVDAAGKGTITPKTTLTIAKDLTIVGSATTAAPNTGTAAAWKLGVKVDATCALDTAKYVQIDIAGTLYKVALITSS